MINGISEKQARGILERLFKDVAGGRITRKQILDKISYKTLTNYSPALVGYDLWTPKKRGRKYIAWELTDKGKEVIVLGAPSIPEPLTMFPRSAPQSDLFAEADRITREFNSRYPDWEWKLTKRGVKSQ